MSVDIAKACHVGNCGEVAPYLPAVQCVVTSPHYWRLRNYEVPPIDWADGWRGPLGMEPTPQMFCAHLADILVKMPLVESGVMWVNMGDTFCGSQSKMGAGETEVSAVAKARGFFRKAQYGVKYPEDLKAAGLKPKDQAFVPARLAMAMQARGWWYRNEIIWQKTNPLPSSVQDRLPVCHEKILMFTKSPRYKFYRDGIQVPVKQSSADRYKYGIGKETMWNTDPTLTRQNLAKPRDAAPLQDEKMLVTGEKRTGGHRSDSIAAKREAAGKSEWWGAEFRSLRDVWEMPTANHQTGEAGAHVAPMPVELARRCILLSTDEGDMVLDPFGGTGTTAAAAEQLGRRWMLIDMDPRLEALTRERISRECGDTRALGL